MAIDPPPPLKRKRGRPPGSKSAKSRIGRPPGAQSPKSKMEQKMALVKQRLALLDSASSSSDSEKPALLHSGDTDYEDDDIPLKPAVRHCGDIDDEDDDIPLKPAVRDCGDTDYDDDDIPLALRIQSASTTTKKQLYPAIRHCGDTDYDDDDIPLGLRIRSASTTTKKQLYPAIRHCGDTDYDDDDIPLGLRIQSASTTTKKQLYPVVRHCGHVDDEDNDIPLKPVIHHCGDIDDEDNDIPLKVLKSRRLDSEQKKLPSAPQAHSGQNIITGINNSAKASDINGQNLSASVHGNCGSVMARAKEVQAKLPAKHPSFVKNMLQSHVVRGFWLGMPTDFCNKHLQKQDTGIMLEDENGEEHHTTYLGRKQGLSAGWRGFAIKHGIKVGDVVVFELVEPTKFKVYIVRANQFTASDGAISLLDLEARKKEKLVSRDEGYDAGEAITTSRVERNAPAEADEAISDSDMIDFGGLRISDSDMEFGDVRSFSDFSIVVDRLVIDCKFPEQVRRAYYELCRSQKAFLHRHLLKQLNLTLVVGAIMETVSIAEGIRACQAARSPSVEDLRVWKTTLESVALLGMDVGFLLRRVDGLLALSGEARQATEREESVRAERARAAEKVEALELALGSVKDALRKIDSDVEEVAATVKRSGAKLQALATAPW